MAELAQNFISATAEWIKAGAKIASKPLYDFRLDACRQCEYWDDQTRLGYGKCNAPDASLNGKKCGCGKGKLLYSTGRCPLGRWEETLPHNLP